MASVISLPARRLIITSGGPLTRSNVMFQSKYDNSYRNNSQQSSSSTDTRRWSFLPWIGGITLVGAGSLAYSLNESVAASDLELHPPKYPWSHKGYLDAMDTLSVRRGWQVYKQVCAACHSLQYVAYREFVDVFLSEEEARAEAAEVMVEDGPDETGKMFMRPGKLSDKIPKPYPNEEAARHANNGALPPDLSYITLARHGGEDYVMALLTGYCDPPAGVVVQEGQYFNPYFPGGAISMPRPLYNETITYDDPGSPPASASQLAKDVCNFLTWTAQPENDYKKKLAIKMYAVVTVLLAMTWYWKRLVWSSLKTRKVMFREPTSNVIPKAKSD